MYRGRKPKLMLNYGVFSLGKKCSPFFLFSQGNHKVYHIMNENIPHIIYQIKTWFIQFNISNWKELVCTLYSNKFLLKS